MGIRMPNKGWKQYERLVAAFFQTRRNPLSGFNAGHSGSDSLHRKFYIECKLRANSYIHSLFQETKPKAKKEGKLPVLAVKTKFDNGFMVAVHSDDLLEFCQLFLEDRGMEVFKFNPKE